MAEWMRPVAMILILQIRLNRLSFRDAASTVKMSRLGGIEESPDILDMSRVKNPLTSIRKQAVPGSLLR